MNPHLSIGSHAKMALVACGAAIALLVRSRQRASPSE